MTLTLNVNIMQKRQQKVHSSFISFHVKFETLNVKNELLNTQIERKIDFIA